jgi:hypothetical protein
MSDTPYSFDAELDSLPSATAERAALTAEREHADQLGVVIGGSLSEGLVMGLVNQLFCGGCLRQ